MSNEPVKLVGTSRDGDFVHQNQTMASKEGFKNVSRAWWVKTEPISKGLEAMAAQAKNREDIRCNVADMKPIMNGVGEVVLEYKDGRQFKPTEHCWSQIANNFGAIPQTTVNWFIGESVTNFGFNYKHNDEASKVFLGLLQYGHARMKVKTKDSRYLFRTYNDGTLRAVLSPEYAIIDNSWYLQVIADALTSSGHEPRLSHWKGDADTIWGNVLVPDTVREEKDSDYGGMISIGNCEIGTRRMLNRPSIFRAICMNGCIWGAEQGYAINKVHRGKIDLKDMRRRIFDNINKQIPLIAAVVDKFLKTRELTFDPKVIRRGQVFTEIGLSYKIPAKIGREMVNQFKQYEGGNDSLFGVVNSLTRAGQVGTSAKEWYDIDVIGGELAGLNANQWGNILNRAQSRTAEELNEYLQLA